MALVELNHGIVTLLREIKGSWDFNADLEQAFFDLLQGLTERERQVLFLMYGLNRFEPSRSAQMNMVETARKLNVTRSRVQQIHTSAVGKLRKKLDRTQWTPFFSPPINGQIRGLKIDRFEFSVRTYNCLRNLNILTLRQLCQYSRKELLRSSNFGRKSLAEIEDVLSALGLSLKGEGVWIIPDDLKRRWLDGETR